MTELDPDAALEVILAQLIAERQRDPLIIGIAGLVASGKSRFAERLKLAVREILSLEIIYLPFDYWINRRNLGASTYAERFFLEDFDSALESVANREPWMCPRYDIEKTGWTSARTATLSFDATEEMWRGRPFRRVSAIYDLPDMESGSGVHIELSSGRPYSLLLPRRNALYLFDGTLIFREPSWHESYTSKIYVTSSWANRIGRMIRRYNRREVFGQASVTQTDYVGFLVREAKSCADKEISAQLSEWMTVVKSEVETISNLLDLYYLRAGISAKPELAEVYALGNGEVEAAIAGAYEYFSSVRDPTRLRRLREELEHLVESKHLLVIENADAILARVRDVLHDQ